MAGGMEKAQNPHVKLIIVGTGFAGIAAAVRLKQEGELDFIILERGDEVGGVWRDNRYPGCACDVESHLYSLSFALNPEWSRKFSPQSEILAYLRKCVEDFGLRKHIHFSQDVNAMEWEEGSLLWRIRTGCKEYRASFVIGAFGALSNPLIPRIVGMEKFTGEVFHSASWPEDFNPVGRRIAVVGTGASAIQFIPHLQKGAEFIHVFQRTPAWVLPRKDEPISEGLQKIYQRFPLLVRMVRLKIYLQREALVIGFRHPKLLKTVEKMAASHLQRAVRDPELRMKLTPGYRIGCKRILLSNTYYPALAQPNVAVNINDIHSITKDAVVDGKGREIPVDAVIFGTGFQVTELPLAKNIYGRTKQSLQEAWNGSPKAYMGTAMAGFPNLFILQGPNTGLGHSSVLLMIEAQVELIIETLQHMRRKGWAAIEPSTLAQNRFVSETDKKMEGTVWTSGGCQSWYIDKTGRNSSLWPGFTFSFMRKTRRWKREDYIGY